MTDKMSKILIVDDDEPVVMELCNLLQSDTVQVNGTYSGSQALSLSFSDRPDLLVIDMVMPDMTGYEVFQALEIHPETEDIAVLFMVRDPEKHRESAARRKKSYRFTGKPCDLDELKRTVDIMLRELSAKKTGAAGAAGDGAQRDRITGLYSGRYVRERLCEEVERAMLYEYPISLITACIGRPDRFHGCEEGITNSLANEVAESIKMLSRAIDIACYEGGLRYTIVMPRMEKSAAHAFAQKLRNSLISQKYPDALKGAVTSVDTGVVQVDPRKRCEGEALFSELEMSLQKAREGGAEQLRMQER